jgi:hypothetical protein
LYVSCCASAVNAPSANAMRRVRNVRMNPEASFGLEINGISENPGEVIIIP